MLCELEKIMESVSVKELLEAGAHFGHQTSQWHPKMKKYIFTQRNGIHIIDLEKTVEMLDEACAFVRDLIASGQSICFVGTKRQAQQVIEEAAKGCGAYYVNQRWLGGMLTNFATIQTRIDYLVRLEDRKEKGEFDNLPKKESSKLEKKIMHMNGQLGGFKEMTSLPGAIFIADPIKDKIAFAEAKKLDIPVVAVTDSNCNPDGIDYPIPANDDAIKTIRLICSKIAEAVTESREIPVSPEETEKPESASPESEEPLEIMGSYTFEPDQA